MNKDRESAMRELLSAIQSLIHDHQVYWGSVDQKPEEEAKELQMLHEGLLNLRDNTSGLRRNQDELKATIESVEESLLKRAYNLRDRVEAIEDNLSDGGVLISRKELLVRLEAVEKKLNSSRYYEPVSPSTPSVAPTVQEKPYIREDGSVDWSKVPEGTQVYTRDNDGEPWILCDFKRFHSITTQAFETTGSAKWNYAKLAY